MDTVTTSPAGAAEVAAGLGAAGEGPFGDCPGEHAASNVSVRPAVSQRRSVRTESI